MVKSLFEIKGILKEYKKELKRHDIRVTKIFLYGSYAHGQPKSYSDIDVIVFELPDTFLPRKAVDGNCLLLEDGMRQSVIRRIIQNPRPVYPFISSNIFVKSLHLSSGAGIWTPFGAAAYHQPMGVCQ